MTEPTVPTVPTVPTQSPAQSLSVLTRPLRSRAAEHSQCTTAADSVFRRPSGTVAPHIPESGPRRPEALARGSVTPRCLLCPRRAQVGIQSDAGRFELACYRCVQVLKLWWFGSPFRTATAARTGHGYFTRSPWRASGVFLADSVQRFDRFRCDHPAETPNPADSLQAPRSAGRAG